VQGGCFVLEHRFKIEIDFCHDVWVRGELFWFGWLWMGLMNGMF